MKDTLYDQLLEAIDDYITGEHVNGFGAAAKACQTISEEWAKGFAEFIARGLWYRYINESKNVDGWERYASSDTDYDFKTTDELIQLYKNSEHGRDRSNMGNQTEIRNNEY